MPSRATTLTSRAPTHGKHRRPLLDGDRKSVQLRVVTANQPGILANVGQTFMGQGINLSEANCRAGDDGRAVNLFSFVCQDLQELKKVMKALQKVKGVVVVERA